MNLLRVLDHAYKTRPNAIHKEILVDQLMRGLEGEVAGMLHVSPPEYEYDNDDPDDIELLMPYPYDDIYLWYLCSQIDMMQEETQLYQHDVTLFNAAWDRAQAWYRRKTKTGRKSNWRVM